MVQLFELLNKRVVTKILQLFLDNPRAEFYTAEIRKKIKISKGSSIKWLRVLVKEGFLIKSQRGKMSIFRLNVSNPIVKNLKILKNISLIYPAFRELSGKCEIYIYGSTARGEDIEDSDIDLLVLGKMTNEISRKIEELRKKLNRNIKIMCMTELEWSQTSRKDPAFYERVEKDKIRVV